MKFWKNLKFYQARYHRKIILFSVRLDNEKSSDFAN